MANISLHWDNAINAWTTAKNAKQTVLAINVKMVIDLITTFISVFSNIQKLASNTVINAKETMAIVLNAINILTSVGILNNVNLCIFVLPTSIEMKMENAKIV